MADTEKEKFRQIGIDLINEYRKQRGLMPILQYLEINTPEASAFIRSIQLHEATKKELQGVKQELADFRQEVSGVVTSLCNTVLVGRDHSRMRDMLSHRFIIPTPKPDPLVEVLTALDVNNAPEDVENLRAALDKLGLEIREKNDG